MKRVYVCLSCQGNGVVDNSSRDPKNEKKVVITKSGRIIELSNDTNAIKNNYYFNNGFIIFGDDCKLSEKQCPRCNGDISELELTKDEWDVLERVSVDSNFIISMDKLKKNDIIDFNLKLSQFRASISQLEQQNEIHDNTVQPASYGLHCPTCGSSNVKKISATKRWFTTGTFGIASSDMAKTMQCGSCGYKW